MIAPGFLAPRAFLCIRCLPAIWPTTTFFFGRVVLKKSFGVQKKSMVAVIVSCFFESQLQLRCHHKAWLQSLFLVLKKSFGVQKKIMLAVIVSCFFESLLQLRCHHKAWLQSLFLVNPPEKKVVVWANGHTLHL